MCSHQENPNRRHHAYRRYAENVLTFICDGPSGQQFLQLCRSNEAAGKRQCTDDDLEIQRRQFDPVDVLEQDKFSNADQARCQCTERVRQRGSLRHGSHGDSQSHSAADDGTGDESENDPSVIDNLLVE